MQALALARHIAMSRGLQFDGLMTYPARGKFAEADRWLADAKALIEEAGIAAPRITSGNSPDIWHTGDLKKREKRVRLLPDAKKDRPAPKIRLVAQAADRLQRGSPRLGAKLDLDFLGFICGVKLPDDVPG